MSSNDDLPLKDWSSGPPPSIGWWPASWYCLNDRLRWWDGESWSIAVSIEHDEKRVQYLMGLNGGKMPIATGDRRKIYWTTRPISWPEESKT